MLMKIIRCVVMCWYLVMVVTVATQEHILKVPHNST